MEQVISTILFNGRFWIAFIEKYEEDGTISVGKYIFGPEPDNNDIYDFYLNKYQTIRFYKCDSNFRIKKKYSKEEIVRKTSKSLELFKEEQKKYLSAKKIEMNRKRKKSETEKYCLSLLKKKEKRRGH